MAPKPVAIGRQTPTRSNSFKTSPSSKVGRRNSPRKPLVSGRSSATNISPSRRLNISGRASPYKR